jgi:hypothetical protein
MKYSSETCRNSLGQYAGSECKDRDLIHYIVECGLGFAIGRLVPERGGQKRARPLPTKEEWEAEQSQSSEPDMILSGTELC